MGKPLEGLKVIEIGQEIQGPFAGLFLADLGADVIKIENKETGDLSRWMLAQLIGGPKVKNAEGFGLLHRDESRQAQYHGGFEKARRYRNGAAACENL